MQLLPLFLCVALALVLHTQAMDPARKGNENFPRNPLEEDTEPDAADSSYPSINVHFNFEPKDWREVELNLFANAAFLKEVEEEQVRMVEEENKIRHVLNLQKEQIDELLLMVKQIQWKQTRVKNWEQADVPMFLRTGHIENESESRQRKVRSYYDLNRYAINRDKYTNGHGLYYNLMEQWSQ